MFNIRRFSVVKITEQDKSEETSSEVITPRTVNPRWKRHERELQNLTVEKKETRCETTYKVVDPKSMPPPERAEIDEDEKLDGFTHSSYRIGSLLFSLGPSRYFNIGNDRYRLKIPLGRLDIQRFTEKGVKSSIQGRNPQLASSSFLREIRAAFHFIKELGYFGIVADPSDERRARIYKSLLESIGCSTFVKNDQIVAVFDQCKYGGTLLEVIRHNLELAPQLNPRNRDQDAEPPVSEESVAYRERRLAQAQRSLLRERKRLAGMSLEDIENLEEPFSGEDTSAPEEGWGQIIA